MKKYKFKLSKLVIAILIVGVVVAVACSVLNVVRFVRIATSNDEIRIYDYFTLIITLAISVLFTVVAFGVIFNSYYEITKKQIILRWGILKNAIDLYEVTEIVLNLQTNKLTVNFQDESYFVIVVNKEWYESFIDDIKEVSPKILFTVNSEPEKKDK